MRFGLFWRLAGVLFLFFTVLRGQFLFWNRELYYDESLGTIFKAFVQGLRFDAVVIGWILLVVLIWGWVVKRAYWVPVFLIMIPFWVLTVIDTELWNFFGRRLSLSVLKMFREADGKMGAMAGQYAIWIFVACVLGAFMFMALWKVCWRAEKFSTENSRKWVIVKQLFFLLLVVVATRGGLQKKPVTLVNAQLFDKSQVNLLVLNTPFSLMKSLKGSGLVKEKNFITQDEALKYMNAFTGTGEAVLPETAFAEKQNVVILILESFSWEYTALNPELKKEYTPFLNSLMAKSLNFTNGFANGRRSIEGVGAMLAGVPALMEEPFITSEFSANQVEGLASVFAKYGYATSFFHGGDNGTMHFDAFAAKMGFEKYYGSREYPKPEDHDKVWGIWDRPYLKYFADTLNQIKGPFFSVLFTLSSHQPYAVPAAEAPLFPEQPEHPILKAITYTDSSLKDFFEYASRQTWFPNTLFVILADHTGPVIFHKSDTPLVAYRIPILFYHPQITNWPEGIERGQLAQQLDVAASLYDFMGFSEAKTVSMSRSLFRPGPRNYTAYAAGVYWHTDGEYILTQQGLQSSFSSLAQPSKKVELPAVFQRKLETSLKAVREIYSTSLWDNFLYFQKPKK